MNKGATYEVPLSYPTFDAKSISTLCNSNNTNSNIHLASPNTLPSIGDFLNSLDQKHNCNVYFNFVNTFLEEEITVNVIRDLSNDQLRKLGVVKIRW
ncbi:hypothetical protein C1646_771430 [Rhizophagus diaphanus]|nr:hypothetical protein C1646_771430 [Rhizophagus diaphanus] [Rhizophagus sp. MUCL 43196]